ncbi:MAG: SdrD B-like domain-containing protein [bacterium]
MGIPGSGIPSPELLQVCKNYPSGTVNPPAVQIKLDVVTTRVISSPTSITYTVQPNSCLTLWWTGGPPEPPDQFTVEEIVPPGYTSSSQVSTIIRSGPSGSPFVTTNNPATSATIITGITGGTGIPGATITFTNTPVPIEPATVNIGDFVWNDLNANGVQDAGEPGIPGVLLQLSNGATTTTDANGAYAFTDLPAGTYTVQVGAPAGFAASPTGAGTPSTDSNGSGTSVTVLTGTDNTIDFGFYKLGAIGDFVWNDLNANGVQDGGEPGIPGVTVTLSNGATTTTDASGAYLFANLAPSNYTVTVSAPAGYTPSPTGAGTPATDSNGSGASTTIAGNTDNTLDFGYYQLGAIGDFVWNDLNANGVQDAGEPGIAGVTVTLSTGATQTTSASGGYLFSNLAPGTYTVTVATPAGTFASPTGAGTSATDNNGSPATVTISGNTDLTIDFGFYHPTPSGTCASILAIAGIPITNVSVTGTGGTGGPYTFSATGLPAGLSMSTAGVISGTPAASGSSSYTVTVKDKDGNTGSFACGVTVSPGVSSSCVVINAVKGNAIVPVTLTGTGGSGAPYKFTATGLPTGLSISTGGTITGTPSVTGTFPYTVTVTDKDGHTGTLNCSVSVNGAPTASCVTINAVKGHALTSVQLVGTGGAGGAYKFTATGLPPGVVISTSGVISGTPTMGGTFSYTVTITDKNGNVGTFNCTITVTVPDTTPPVCSVYANASPPYMSYQDGGSGIVRLEVTTNLNKNYKVTVSPAPAGMTISGGQANGSALTSGTIITFPVGQTALIKVSALHQLSGVASQLTVKAIDAAGLSVSCDPIETTVTRLKQDNGVQTFYGVPYEEHFVTIENGGLKSLEIDVNGTVFKVKRLDDNEIRTVDISSAMKHNTNNTITLTPKGKKGESADVSIGPTP